MKIKYAFAFVLIFLLMISSCNHLLGKINQDNPSSVWVNEDFGPNIEGWKYDKFSNIQEAVDIVMDGGTVFLVGDNYNGPYPIEIYERDITIMGNGISEIVGNGEKDVFMVKDSYLSIEGCTISGGLNGISAIRSNIVLNRDIISGNSLNGIKIVASSFSDSRINVKNCIIEENDNGIACYSYFDSMLDANIINNTISNNHGNAISFVPLDPSTQTYKIVNNIVSDNAGIGFFSLGSYDMISYNDFWNNTFGNFFREDMNGRFGNITADPSFKDDYQLDIDSPCIDTGLDTGRSYYGNTNHDIDELGRPQGKQHDMGAYESAIVRILHLSDPHLLAPINGELAYGRGYDTYMWENADIFLSKIKEDVGLNGIDLVVITGDIVNWATNSSTYQTFLGETYVVTEWENTYDGYLLFKEKIVQHFGDIPILEVVGNHEYRENPFLFWTWNDTIGIDEGFKDNINYSEYEMNSLSHILEMPLENDISLHLLNSGHDVIGTNYVLNNILLPFLSYNAENFDELLPMLEGGMDSNNLYEFSENLAYGAGFTDSQIDALSYNLELYSESINLVFCHHPIVYPGITISRNIEDFLEICRDYIVPFVFSGHTHTSESYHVEWTNGSNTYFNTAGSAIDGRYNLISCQLGKENQIKIK